jgi:hypothetical protein
MKEHDLPSRAARCQLLVEPVELCLVDVVAVEREEPDAIPRSETIEALAVHIERLVVPLQGGVVMVAERGIELYAGIQQWFIRNRKLLIEVARPLAAVDVVAHHDDEIEEIACAPRRQLVRDATLVLIAGACVADHRELD